MKDQNIADPWQLPEAAWRAILALAVPDTPHDQPQQRQVLHYQREKRLSFNALGEVESWHLRTRVGAAGAWQTADIEAIFWLTTGEWEVLSAVLGQDTD